ncbi:MAG: DUF1290 domain-containing protein [Ruminococcaceae bacterium]|nr:DUF1290 domain-containing protein [Oscillospiraceae bacterium]
MIFLIAGILGVIAGLLVPYNISSSTLPYVAVAIIAALDSVFGAWNANLNKKFNLNVFMIGLVSNAVLAVLLTYMGNLLGISLYFAAIIVFGVRMFNNMSSIRRKTFDIYFEKRARETARLKRLALRAAEEKDIKKNAKDIEPKGETKKNESADPDVEKSADDEGDKEEKAEK